MLRLLFCVGLSCASCCSRVTCGKCPANALSTWKLGGPENAVTGSLSKTVARIGFT